jgi:hypothetical protein
MQVNHDACVCLTSRALFPDDVRNKKKKRYPLILPSHIISVYLIVNS